jgi:hypothetical protein
MTTAELLAKKRLRDEVEAAARIVKAEYNRRWRAARPGYAAAASKAWRAKNPDFARLSVRAWKVFNRDRDLAIQKAWRERNPNYFRERLARLRAQQVSP